MLTNNEIKRQIDLGNIDIENLQPNALAKPNSCNVSIADRLYTYDYMIVDTNKKYEYLDEIINDKPKSLNMLKIPPEGLILEPNKVYLTKTNEKIITKNYIPVLNGRTSLSLLGLSIELTSGYGHENYNGNMLISIVATKPTIIYPNINIGNLNFFESLKLNEGHIGMLSGEEIKRCLESGEIIIKDSENIVINPNSVNLTLNPKISYYTEPILDLHKNNPIESVIIPDTGFIIEPNEIYLARTNEWTETYNHVPMMSGRSSLGRVGLHIHCSAGLGSIGYKGYWHMGLRPKVYTKIYKDMKCCQIYYYTVEGKITNTYEGSMQNIKDEEINSQFYKSLTRKKN